MPKPSPHLTFLLLFALATSAQAAPLVGADRDKRGCIASAGYTWSTVQKSCIRLFEKGIALQPEGKSATGATLVAYLVFKSMDEDAVAEIFLPGAKRALLLPRVKDSGAGTWKTRAYTLTQWKGMYTLENAKGKTLFSGMANP